MSSSEDEDHKPTIKSKKDNKKEDYQIKPSKGGA